MFKALYLRTNGINVVMMTLRNTSTEYFQSTGLIASRLQYKIPDFA